VSHDRYFLDAVAKNICEIERAELTCYKGGYSSFMVQKAERRRTAMKAWEKQQEEIAHMEDYVRRNMARASTTGMAKSRQKTLNKMERLEKPKPEPKGIALCFTCGVEPFSTVLQCKGLGVYVGDEETGRQLYSDVELVVKRGEKIALVGENGVGKSTFLKAVQNLVEHTGHVQWGGNVRPGYFDQELAGLDMDSTVMEAVHSRYPQKTEFEIRSALGRLLLEGDAVYKKVRELSGANRAKVAFAILEMRGANVLLLDEPTNHLDYRAKEVLEQALLNFEGTLLVVSHDRYFLRRVPHRILEMRNGGFENYVGNYDDYLSKKQQMPAPVEKPSAQSGVAEEKAPQGNYRSKARRAADAQRRTALAAAEKEVAGLEAEVEELNAQLASPEVASNYEKLAELGQALEKNTVALEQAMGIWLELSGDE
jgi:ATP-binding cassette subfamily F protein 3